MADNKVRFELVSPERVLASEDVDMVTLPGAEGEFGVLPQHAPLLALLRPGVISTYEGNTVKERIFVTGGFAEVNEEGCSVLAEQAQPVAELLAEEARRLLEEANAAYAKTSDEDEARLQAGVALAEARVEALTTTPAA
ncbi:ATP synthase F1 subunit epsilon [Marinivivus vitaminiproducens]|uniref:ATP synthase F1 subunit epsilon n=1 Tax=Marinivivus vitaminiproducens TaxID=3035935 RepID=UPI0027A6935A|nr:ATP synthase F1 subunit epsilon [Geminicoccaceae bacterium SCSIO 64248]